VKAGKLRALTVFQKGHNPSSPMSCPPWNSGYDVTHPVVYFIIGPKGMDKRALDTYTRCSGKWWKGKKYGTSPKRTASWWNRWAAELTKELDQWMATYQMPHPGTED